MTIREIAEKLNANTRKGLIRSIPDMQVAFLLDALVEERAMRRKAEFWREHEDAIDIGGEAICDACARATAVFLNSRHNWTDNDWCTQALNELDLDKVWPVKEKEKSDG